MDPKNTQQGMGDRSQQGNADDRVRSKAKAKAEEGQREAERLKEDAATATEQMQEEARETVEAARDSAAEAMRQAREEGASFAARQKDRAASEISTIEEAIRRAASKLDDENDERLASWVEAAADGVGRTASYLKGNEPGHLVEDVEDVARQRPELFYGGLFVAGLGIARFLKASRPRSRRRSDTTQRDGVELHQNYTPPSQVATGVPAGASTASTRGPVATKPR
ncbi:hypothetical protein Mal4_13190 [Maioricimonas rarisocia]|uniref:Uncharacterized protein n=1 Tax=Maioricimonas rarisocia TaxID=2528026 RepID=A0A517Z3J1_9PLAN|nr:ATP synthase F0 subunit B [Maioricimonas rarisocia]QDU37016.1 hypothetical protein Mal4_13190 [Maioricimonas rarisocia]